jgi:hypothetical protein
MSDCPSLNVTRRKSGYCEIQYVSDSFNVPVIESRGTVTFLKTCLLVCLSTFNVPVIVVGEM